MPNTNTNPNSNTDVTRHDATKRIPKSLGTDTKLLGSYTLTDLVVGLLPGVLVILVTRIVLPRISVYGYSVQALAIPLAVLAIGLGLLFVYLTPAYATSVTWLTTALSFYTDDRQAAHDAAAELTNVERVHLDHDAVERTDGTFVGLVEVRPPTMALATAAEWRTKAQSFQEFLNTTIEFPVQIYSTTQPFPVDDYLGTYEARLSDPDVQDNPILEDLITNYTEWYREDVQHRQTTIRDHYVVVPVSPREVRHRDESLTGKLSDLPVIGVFIAVVTADHVEVERAAMRHKLDERLRKIQRGLRDIDGCEPQRVEATAAAELLAEHWTGDQIAYGDTEQALRTTPMATRDRNHEERIA